MNDFYINPPPNMDDYEIIVEMPMSGKRAYGAFFTSRATDDDILRIRRGDEDLVLMHPDGKLEVAAEKDAFVAGAQWADRGVHTEAEIAQAAEEWLGRS